MNDKIIVTNLGALKKKYGANGVAKIRAAVKALISADKVRGLQTRLIALDRASDMKKVHGSRVSAADNCGQNKKAIDAIYATLRPDYLLILGAIDVVPHQDLINPAFGGDDVDQYAYGDIPYACEEPYGQQADKFIGPTRVVGRLPDVTGGADPGYLIGLLETATLWKSLTQQDYSDYFAISAAVWKDSTTLSVQKTFGSSKNLNLSPPRGPKWTDATLARRAHFINCHGGQTDPQFYGQKGNQYPIAHQAALVAGKITEGTVAAIECCYGGELYDPNLLAPVQAGICNTYLAEKAYGFFASSTIAYGPATGNGSADLLCQYFLRRVLAGASIGRAALEARQEFAQAGPDLDPFDIKTLAQFSLFGDPSIQPVAAPTPHTAVTTAKLKGVPRTGADQKNFAGAVARGERRKQLLAKGTFIRANQRVASRTPRARVPGSILATLRRLARKSNMRTPKILSFRIVGGGTPAGAHAKKAFAAAKAKLPEAGAYYVAMTAKQLPNIPAPQITAVIAKEFDGKLVSYRELHSR